MLIGTTGERGIGVAREVADGVLLPEGTGERALAWCARRLGGHGSITTYAWLRVDEDPDDARARMVPVARDWLATGLYPNLIAHGAVDADDPEAAVDRIAIAGPPRECARAIARFSAAGASSIILAPVGPDPDEQLE